MFKYLHNGFLRGVPARDLTDEEAKQYDVEKLTNSGLYIRWAEGGVVANKVLNVTDLFSHEDDVPTFVDASPKKKKRKAPDAQPQAEE